MNPIIQDAAMDNVELPEDSISTSEPGQPRRRWVAIVQTSLLAAAVVLSLLAWLCQSDPAAVRERSATQDAWFTSTVTSIMAQASAPLDHQQVHAQVYGKWQRERNDDIPQNLVTLERTHATLLGLTQGDILAKTGNGKFRWMQSKEAESLARWRDPEQRGVDYPGVFELEGWWIEEHLPLPGEKHRELCLVRFQNAPRDIGKWILIGQGFTVNESGEALADRVRWFSRPEVLENGTMDYFTHARSSSRPGDWRGLGSVTFDKNSAIGGFEDRDDLTHRASSENGPVKIAWQRTVLTRLSPEKLDQIQKAARGSWYGVAPKSWDSRQQIAFILSYVKFTNRNSDAPLANKAVTPEPSITATPPAPSSTGGPAATGR